MVHNTYFYYIQTVQLWRWFQKSMSGCWDALAC